MEPSPEHQREAAKAELRRVMEQFGLTRDDVVALIDELPPVAAVGGQLEEAHVASPPPPEHGQENAISSLSHEVAGELENGQASAALEPLKRQLEEQELKNLGEAIGGLVIWLGEKLELFRGLTEEGATDKIKTGWNRMFDYLLTVDLAADLQEHIPDDRASAIGSSLQALVAAMQHRKQLLQTTLQEKGITRIVAPPESDFMAGLVEWINDDPVPTDNPRLHGKVAFVAPGNHGFRYRGRPIVTTYAHRYEYRAGRTSE